MPQKVRFFATYYSRTGKPQRVLVEFLANKKRRKTSSRSFKYWQYLAESGKIKRDQYGRFTR